MNFVKLTVQRYKIFIAMPCSPTAGVKYKTPDFSINMLHCYTEKSTALKEQRY